MIIAVASEKEMVSKHFGHCANFNIYEVEGDKIVGEENVQSPGHGHGNLPGFLAEKGVTVLISGGMGQGAIDKCKEYNIEPIRGAEGKAKDAAEAYAKGELESVDTVCAEHGGGHKHKHQHKHEHKCGS